MANYLKDSAYLTYLDQLEQINGMPKGLLPRVMRAESGGKPGLTSKAGAKGLFQFLPGTAKEVGINPDDPVEAAGGSAIYLRRLYNQFGSWDKAVAAYNAGPGNIAKGRYPTETKNYVAKVFGKEPPAAITPKVAPPKEVSIPGEIAPPKQAAMLPPILSDLAEGVVKYLGIPGVTSEGLNLKDIKRLPGVAATHVMKGLGEAADFFLGGPIISTQQTAPALGLTPLPEIPHDVVTQGLASAGLIRPQDEPKTPRERRVAGVSELVGMGAVDPTVIGGVARGGAALGKHLLEEVGTKAAGSSRIQRGIVGELPAVKKPPAEVTPALREKRAKEQGYLPTTLYHGTVHRPQMEAGYEGAGIEAFDPRAASTSTAWYGKGHYLTADPEMASGFAMGDPNMVTRGGTVYPVRARLKKPFVYDKGGNEATLLKNLSSMKGWTVAEQALINSRGPLSVERVVNEVGPERFTKVLKDNGHDGVIVNRPGKPMDEVVTFDPKQIRSTFADFSPKALEKPIIGATSRYSKERGAVGTLKEVTPEERAARATEQGYIGPFYHGTVHAETETGKGIEAFDPTRVGKTTDYGWYGRGIYKSARPELASRYAGATQGMPGASGGTVYPLMTRMKKPFVYNKVMSLDQSDPLFKDTRLLHSNKMREELLTMKGWNEQERALLEAGTVKGQRGKPLGLNEFVLVIGPDRFNKVLRANEYDGVIVNRLNPNDPQTSVQMEEVVSFDPKQIRSVHADFDPKSLEKPIIGATSLFSKERGAVGHLGAPPPTQAAAPTHRVLELSATIRERNQVRKDIERLSSQSDVLSNNQTRRLGELTNHLAILDTTIGGLGGAGARPALEQTAALNAAPNVREIARRGRQSWAESERLARRAVGPNLPATQEVASLVGATPKDVDAMMRRRIGTAYNAENVVAAAHHLKTQWADDHTFYKDMAAKIDAGKFSPADIVTAHERILGTTALQSQYSGIAAEAGRALNVFKRTRETTDLANQVHEALAAHENTRLLRWTDPEEMLREKIKLLAQLDPANPASGVQGTRRLLKANSWDKVVYEFMYASMFSGVPTQVANAAGNLGVRLFEDVVRTGVSLVPGSSVTMREAAANLYAWPAGLIDGLTAFSKVMKTEIPWGYYEHEVLSRAIKGFKGKVIRLPLRFMAATDGFFKAMTYATERRALAMRESIKSGVPVERYLDIATAEGKVIDKRAVAEAHRRTFTDPSGPILKAIENLRSSHPLGRLFLPIVHTPGKMLKMSLENSPLGILFRDVRAQLKAGGAERDLMLGRIALGTGIGAYAFMLAQKGLITGAAPENEAERDMFYASGRKPYARKVGNQWVPYKRFEPFATYLGAMADAHDIQMNSTFDEKGQVDWGKMVVALVGGIARNFTDKTFMQSMSDTVDALHDPGRFGERYGAGLVGRFIPAIVAHTAKAEDPYMREANSLMDRLRMRLPKGLDIGFGTRADLPRRVSGLGELVREEGTFGEKLMSPFVPSAFRDDPLVEELLRLKKGIGTQERYKHKTILNKQYKINLDPATYEFLATTRGRVLRQLMTNVISAPGYQNLPEYEKAALLDDILHKAKSQVGRALGKGLEGKILRLAIEQHPSILDIPRVGRPASPP